MLITNSNGNTNYHAERKVNTPPAIIDQFVDDDGELNYVLDNGRETLANRYNSLWHPTKKIINWKAKGETIESKQRKY